MTQRKRHCNIPVFIPQQACPHQCIYCNQRYISGTQKAPAAQEVRQIIETYLSSAEKGTDIQVAFFGGTFTGLDIAKQKSYLETVKPYIQEGRIQSVRLSTRPDCINNEILDLLSIYDVKDIELGAQSLDDEVLALSERGHTAEDVEKASALIKSYGFQLGLQMMIGLPSDTFAKSLNTAKEIVRLGAVSTRIYPTLVIDRTPLAELYRQGKYQPLTTEQAVQWSKEIYKIFADAGVTVLRVGLHPSEDLLNKTGYIAGPFHVSFFELVLTAIWKDRFSDLITANPEKSIITVRVNPADINYAIGYQSSNKRWLQTISPNIQFIQDSTIDRGRFAVQTKGSQDEIYV